MQGWQDQWREGWSSSREPLGLLSPEVEQGNSAPVVFLWEFLPVDLAL